MELLSEIECVVKDDLLLFSLSMLVVAVVCGNKSMWKKGGIAQYVNFITEKY